MIPEQTPVPEFQLGEIWADTSGDAWLVAEIDGYGRATLQQGDRVKIGADGPGSFEYRKRGHVVMDGERLNRLWGPLTLIQGAIQ